MTNLNYVLLYVDNPRSSADVYEKLLGKAPDESHPTFVEFSLRDGLKLGLWSKHTAEPLPIFSGSSAEIAFTEKDKASVDSIYKAWTDLGSGSHKSPQIWILDTLLLF